MRRKHLPIGLAALVLALGGSAALAQEGGGPVIVPVDVFECKYQEGKGPADLDEAVAAWNAYVDGSSQPDVYSAWTLTKHYAGAAMDFDFVWLGAWKNANAMGSGMDDYLANAGDVQAGFAEVSQCDSVSNFASINLRPTPNNDTPADGVLVVSDCSVEEGRTDADVAAAMQAWSALLDEHGLEVGIFHWYPVFGGGGERTYDFKSVETFRNHTAFGAYYEAMGNGGLYRKSTELFESVMSCDVARVYNVKNRRFTQLRK